MKLYLRWFLLTILLISQLDIWQVHGATVGKGMTGGRAGKVMRYKSGNRKGGVQQRPILPSATNAPPGGGGLWRRDEADAYYNNPHGARVIDGSHFESEYILGRKLHFNCMAQGIPRPHITWMKDGIELYGHPFFQVHEYNVGKDRIKSKMEIDPTTQKDSGFYECQADNKYAVDRRGFRTDYTLDVY